MVNGTVASVVIFCDVEHYSVTCLLFYCAGHLILIAVFRV